MAQETLNIAAVTDVNAIWTGSANIVEQYDVATAYFEMDAAGDYAGRAAMENTAETPTAINHFKIIYWDSAEIAVPDDGFYLEFYDLDSTSWIAFSASPLETSETEYIDDVTESFLSDLQAKFAAAADKQDWINALDIRWRVVVVKGADGIIISTRGIEIEIEYTPAADFIPAPQIVIVGM